MKLLLRKAAGLLAVLVAAAFPAAPVHARDAALTADEIAAAAHQADLALDQQCRQKMNRLTAGPEARLPVTDVSGLPSKADLRDMDGRNYVSEVKKQDPWGTCWSFAAVAAAEASIACGLGHDFSAGDNSLFDLSELHLAWFAATALPEDCAQYPSQGGEGLHTITADTDDISDVSRKKLEQGGFVSSAAAVWSAGMGPAAEKTVPYGKTSDADYSKIRLVAAAFSDEGMIDPGSFVDRNYPAAETDAEALAADWRARGYEETDPETGEDVLMWARAFPDRPFEELKGKKVFALLRPRNAGDWSVDESLRFGSLYFLKNGNLLPDPALRGADGAYVFNRAGIDAIRSELAQGRAVAAAFSGDYGEPGMKVPDGTVPFMRFLDADGQPSDDPKAAVWVHYTFDSGYNPSDPASVNRWVHPGHAVCIVGYDDSFPKEYFNDPNGTIGGDGAFLVKNSEGSSINSDPRAVSDWGNGGSGFFWLSYYDQSLAFCASFEFDTAEAAEGPPLEARLYDFLPVMVQTSAGFAEDIRMANVFAADRACLLRFAGFETANAETDVDYSVYLLDSEAESPVDGTLMGEYSAHFTYAGFHTAELGEGIRIPEGSRYAVVIRERTGDRSELTFTLDLNSAGIDYYGLENLGCYARTVVNPGESFVGCGGIWTDWTEIVSRLETLNRNLNNSGFAYDNLPIRCYTQAE